MKIVCKSAIALALVLLSTPVISAEGLSKRRNFSLGTSLQLQHGCLKFRDVATTTIFGYPDALSAGLDQNRT
jgi:hypothetical protein